MRKFTGAAVLIAMGLLAAAPAAPAQELSVGLTAGGGLSNMSAPEDGAEMRFQPSWSAGAYAALPLPFLDGLAVQPELLYTRKGATEDIHIVSIDRTIRRHYRTSYVEAPLLVRYTLPLDPGLGLSPFVLAGPAPAVNLDATLHTGDLVEDISDEIATFDLGFVLGGGVRYATPFGTARLNARYTLGLLNVDDSTVSYGANRNRAFGLWLGFERTL